MWGNEFHFQFWHPSQRFTKATNVPTNRKIDNFKSAEIWLLKFLMFNFKSLLLYCLSNVGRFLGHLVDVDQFVGSTDRASSQQLQMWFSEHFFAPKLAA